MDKYYFHEENFSLIHWDTKLALSKMQENTVDMIFSDPPYFLSNWWFTVQSWKRVNVNKWSWDKSMWDDINFLFHLEWLKEAHRVLKNDWTIWISGTYHSIYQCWYILQLLGYHILNDICWFKPNASPNLSCRFFTASHETIIWARKNKNGKHYFDYQSMKLGDWRRDFLKKPWLQMRSVWSITPPGKNEKMYWKHPTQKLIELLKRVILASTKEGDLVLDPFSGSWTTWIACKRLDRKFIWIDKDENYLIMTILRYKWEDLSQKISRNSYFI